MFYERHDSLLLDQSNMSFLSDGVYDEMCTTNPLKDEHWEKMQNLLPTPPCSPEDFCYHTFPELPASANLQDGLQVVPMKKLVPDNLADTEIEPLPVLDLSDEEMQKLTSPTVLDDSMWLQSLPNPPPTSTLPTRDQFESKNASDVNCISHGIRTVHISDSVIGTSPGFSHSYILTVNANPIQPLNTVGHLTTREVFMSQNATTWSLNSDTNFMNERATRVGTFDATTQAVMPESPTKKGRRIRRLSRNEVVAVVGATEENAEDSEDSETTRATHNVLERKRREELKEKFQRLRDCLPELQDNDRAPKVLILKKSHEYVRFLEQEEQRLLADKELEIQRQIILLNRRQSLLSM